MVLRASRRGLDPSDSNTHTRVRAPLRMIRASRRGLDPSEFEPGDPSAFDHGRDRRSIDTPISRAHLGLEQRELARVLAELRGELVALGAHGVGARGRRGLR